MQQYPQDSKDFKTQILKAKATEPEAIVVNPQTETSGATLVKQLRELGISLPMYGTFVFSAPNALTIGGSALERILFTDAPAVPKESSRGKTLLDHYLKTSGGKPPAHELLVVLRYESVQILKDAIENTKSLDSDSIKNFMTGMEYEGIAGTYRFNEKGDAVGIPFTVKTIKNGKVELVQ